MVLILGRCDCYARSLIHDHQKQIFKDQDLLHLSVWDSIVDLILMVMFKAQNRSITITNYVNQNRSMQTELYRSEISWYRRGRIDWFSLI